LLLQLAVFGIVLNGAAEFHAALIEQLAAGFGVGAFVRRWCIQVARHMGDSQAE
jgi:hypothetical protein